MTIHAQSGRFPLKSLTASIHEVPTYKDPVLSRPNVHRRSTGSPAVRDHTTPASTPLAIKIAGPVTSFLRTHRRHSITNSKRKALQKVKGKQVIPKRKGKLTFKRSWRLLNQEILQWKENTSKTQMREEKRFWAARTKKRNPSWEISLQEINNNAKKEKLTFKTEHQLQPLVNADLQHASGDHPLCPSLSLRKLVPELEVTVSKSPPKAPNKWEC